MFDTAGIGNVREWLAAWVRDLEPGLYAGEDALGLLEQVAELKRLAGAAETLLAARVAETEAWRTDGRDRTAGHWLARRIGVSVAEARAKLETAERLAELPATDEVFRAGRLSEQQAREVTEGAAADPRAEAGLLATAAQDSLRELRNESRRAQAVDDEEGRQRRIHQRRRVHAGVRSDGSFTLSFEGTAAAGSEILTALAPFADAAFNAAQAQGRNEPLAAYRADGLVAMARAARSGDGTATPKSNAKVIVAVDVHALRRGSVESGETCEIKGVGPVPVATAKELLGEAALAVVIKDGIDVLNVTHLRRRTTAHQRTVLEFWGLRCDVKGCDSTEFVDVHHTFEWARSHRTRLDELAVRCRYHHRREHQGWTPTDDQLRRRPGSKRDDDAVEAELPLGA
jgi:hypothetical protein